MVSPMVSSMVEAENGLRASFGWCVIWFMAEAGARPWLEINY